MEPKHIFSAGVLLYFMFCGNLPLNSYQTGEDEVPFNAHAEFARVSVQCKCFIFKLLQKDPHNRPTAEQASSQMWSSSCEMECINTISGMPDARVHDLSMAFGHHEAHATSSHFLDRKREERPAQEDDPDTKRDSFGQRGSFCRWPRTINRMMSKLRPNKAINQALHSSNTDIGKSGAERRKSKTGEMDAWHSEASDGFSTIPPVQSDSSLNQPPSKASGGPNSYVTQDQAGHLLQLLPSSELASGSGSQVVRPEHPKQVKSWLGLGRLFTGYDRKEDRRVHPGDDI